MSDPAVEAARRAGSGWYTAREVEAAREALKPIQGAVENPKNRLHDFMTGRAYISADALAPLIYASGELE